MWRKVNAMTLTWTRLRSGLWHATRNGQVVATIERTGCLCVSSLPYTLRIPSRGIVSKHRDPREARQEAREELE